LTDCKGIWYRCAALQLEWNQPFRGTCCPCLQGADLQAVALK